MDIDYIAAQRFLEALGEKHFFQTFDDNQERKNKSLIHQCHGTLPDHGERLGELNALGAGVFVTVNETDGHGRQESNIVGLRALFIDLDNKPIPTFALPPSIVVQRDELHSHAYWLLQNDQSLQNFRTAQKQLITYYGSDKAIHDLPRVMRIPGFVHNKVIASPVIITSLRDQRYTIDEVLRAHPIKDAQFDFTEFMHWSARLPTSEGERNISAFKIAAEAIGRGFSPDQITSAVMDYCRRSGLPESEGRTVVSSAEKKPRVPQQTTLERQRKKVEEETPTRRDVKPSFLLGYNTEEDPTCLLGKRFICEAGSLLLSGQTGIGKSSFSTQAICCWALGESLFGIKPVRPLRSLVVQAENDLGDLSEQLKGVVNGLNLSTRAYELDAMVTFISESAKTGDDFIKFLRHLVVQYSPDLVWIDPLLSFIGGDISSQETCSRFLRNLMTPLAQEFKFAYMIVHHTGKPSKDPKRNQTNNDMSYAGIGSSELMNWARAIAVLHETSEGCYEFRITKRGRRAEMTTASGVVDVKIPLQHGRKGICWERGEAPITEEETIQAFVDGVINDLRMHKGVEPVTQEYVIKLIENQTGKKRSTIMRPGTAQNKILVGIKHLCTSNEFPSKYCAPRDLSNCPTLSNGPIG